MESHTSEKSLRLASSAVAGPADAARFVAERVLEGADSIKVIVEDPGSMWSAALDVATIASLVEAAHRAGLKVIAHISAVAALRTAADAGVDIITHAPLDAPVDDNLASSLAEQGIVSVPMITMMRAVASRAELLPTHGAALEYAHVKASVSALHRAGIPILAGTDANAALASPPDSIWEALHEELHVLVETGLTPMAARSAACCHRRPG